jgi:molybdopterin molybdotransferase
VRPFKSTISLEEARRLLAEHVTPIDRTERIPLMMAAGRVAAADVTSPLEVPPFSRSAMDGYAVVAADTEGASRAKPVTLRVVDRVFTGRLSTHDVSPGRCAEIATGAPLPAGADAVVMVEETGPGADETVQVFAAARAGQNIGRKGADISRGDFVVRRGDALSPARIGALAAIGCSEIAVFERPRVALVSTGNEVIEPGESLEPGQIYDVNRFTLSAVVEEHGGLPISQSPAHDDLAGLNAALDRAIGADLIVFSGGSSVGDRDLLIDLIAERGEVVFHGIAVKPGKPTLFARVNATPVFGMPGNPTSCLSNAYILLAPFLRTLGRLPSYPARTLQVPLGSTIVSPAGRHQFYTVRIENGVAYPAFKASGDITSLSRADGYIEIPSTESTVREGTPVTVTLF